MTLALRLEAARVWMIARTLRVNMEIVWLENNGVEGYVSTWVPLLTFAEGYVEIAHNFQRLHDAARPSPVPFSEVLQRSPSQNQPNCPW